MFYLCCGLLLIKTTPKVSRLKLQSFHSLSEFWGLTLLRGSPLGSLSWSYLKPSLLMSLMLRFGERKQLQAGSAAASWLPLSVSVWSLVWWLKDTWNSYMAPRGSKGRCPKRERRLDIPLFMT